MGLLLRPRDRRQHRSSLPSVLANLTHILQSRAGFSWFDENFGLEDYRAGERDLIPRLSADIVDNVTRYEPRLYEPTLQALTQASGGELRFELRAMLDGQPFRVELRFENGLAAVIAEAR